MGSFNLDFTKSETLVLEELQHTSGGGDLLSSWKACMGNLWHIDWVLAQELQVRLVFLQSGVGWTQV